MINQLHTPLSFHCHDAYSFSHQ